MTKVALARQNSVSIAITIDNPKSVNFRGLKPLVQLATKQWQRFWWHTKAYGTILSVMLLTLMSLIYLGIHWSFKKLLPVVTHRVFSSHEWGIGSNK